MHPLAEPQQPQPGGVERGRAELQPGAVVEQEHPCPRTRVKVSDGSLHDRTVPDGASHRRQRPAVEWDDGPVRVPDWSVVVPVKRLAEAKTRLRGGLPPEHHRRLVLAMVQDTVRAVLACPVVAEAVVVTDEPEVWRQIRALGATPVPDRPAAGLNAALAYGATVATRPWVAALAADLPALRPADLAGALRAAASAGRRCFVPDAAGGGTTLLTAPPGARLDARFGPDSAQRHAASGAHRLAGDWPTLRRDVDTQADLAAAGRLGLGPRTAEVLREIAPLRVDSPRAE